MAKKLTVSFAVILLVSPVVFGSLSFAQVDPEKALIGVWEGQAEVPRTPLLTLVVTAVEPTASDQWVGRGRFGGTGYTDTETPGGKTEISISSKNNEIYLEWVGAMSKAPVRVKMINDNKMQGTIELFEKGRVAPKRITFEKVKAGDVK